MRQETAAADATRQLVVLIDQRTGTREVSLVKCDPAQQPHYRTADAVVLITKRAKRLVQMRKCSGAIAVTVCEVPQIHEGTGQTLVVACRAKQVARLIESPSRGGPISTYCRNVARDDE
jgi:hypothetical protein